MEKAEQGKANVRPAVPSHVDKFHSEHRETQKPPTMAGLSSVCKGRLYLEESGGGRQKKMVGISA